MIRELNPGDINACAQIFVEAYNRMPWNYSWTIDKATAYLTEYTTASGFAGFVAETDGIISGALLGHRKTWWTGDQFFIDEVFVAPHAQGTGLGKSLLKHCEEHCRTNGITTLSLMANQSTPAYWLYNNLDYTKVDQYAFMFKQL